MVVRSPTKIDDGEGHVCSHANVQQKKGRPVRKAGEPGSASLDQANRKDYMYPDCTSMEETAALTPQEQLQAGGFINLFGRIRQFTLWHTGLEIKNQNASHCLISDMILGYIR